MAGLLDHRVIAFYQITYVMVLSSIMYTVMKQKQRISWR